MMLRLRTGPPRRRRGVGGAAGIGLAALAAVALPWCAIQSRGSDAGTGGPVRLELLDRVAAEAVLPPSPKPFLDRHRVVA